MTESPVNQSEAPRFAIFRAKDAQPEEEMTVMSYEQPSPAVAAAAARMKDAGYEAGSRLRLLFEMPGMSLVQVWFKSEFPLPRHSHNADCLYYIVAGSLRIGQEELGPGDGFFVGSDVPYAYTPGPEGVEVLEFRTSNAFNIRVLANNPLFWDKAVETVRKQQSAWASETELPSSRRSG